MARMAQTRPLPRAPRTRRPQARGIATRRRLLDAAEELLARNGYEATSMAEIAAAGGVGVGTLYHHFPDKRALLLALVDDWGDRELEGRREEARFERYLGDDPRGALLEDLRRRYKHLKREGGFYLVLLELADRDNDVRQRLHRIRQVGVERLRALLEYGQQRGRMRKDVDPLVAAFLITQTIDMAANEVLVHRMTKPEPDAVLEELTDMISRYILEDPA
jgi:AcrR family transcriptional regulator